MDQREYKKYLVTCQEDSACPAAEESLPIELVLDAVHKLKYENYTSSFFIRDISECGRGVNLLSAPDPGGRGLHAFSFIDIDKIYIYDIYMIDI